LRQKICQSTLTKNRENIKISANAFKGKKWLGFSSGFGVFHIVCDCTNADLALLTLFFIDIRTSLSFSIFDP
jgi:hypothetical protein